MIKEFCRRGKWFAQSHTVYRKHGQVYKSANGWSSVEAFNPICRHDDIIRTPFVPFIEWSNIGPLNSDWILRPTFNQSLQPGKYKTHDRLGLAVASACWVFPTFPNHVAYNVRWKIRGSHRWRESKRYTDKTRNVPVYMEKVCKGECLPWHNCGRPRITFGSWFLPPPDCWRSLSQLLPRCLLLTCWPSSCWLVTSCHLCLEAGVTGRQLCNTITGFSSANSENWIQVIRLAQQAWLPTEPSCWL